jgi:hypothetical protein
MTDQEAEAMVEASLKAYLTFKDGDPQGSLLYLRKAQAIGMTPRAHRASLIAAVALECGRSNLANRYLVEMACRAADLL